MTFYTNKDLMTLQIWNLSFKTELLFNFPITCTNSQHKHHLSMRMLSINKKQAVTELHLNQTFQNEATCSDETSLPHYLCDKEGFLELLLPVTLHADL